MRHLWRGVAEYTCYAIVVLFHGFQTFRPPPFHFAIAGAASVCLSATLKLLSLFLSLLVCQFATYLHGSLNKYQAEIRCAKLTDY